MWVGGRSRWVLAREGRKRKNEFAIDSEDERLVSKAKRGLTKRETAEKRRRFAGSTSGNGR